MEYNVPVPYQVLVLMIRDMEDGPSDPILLLPMNPDKDSGLYVIPDKTYYLD
jgi:hypothetical protein